MRSAIYTPPPKKPLTPHKYYTRNNTNPISPNEPFVRRHTPPKPYNLHENLIKDNVRDLSSDEEEDESLQSGIQEHSRISKLIRTTVMVIKNMILWTGLSFLAVNVYLISMVRRLKIWKYPFTDTQQYDTSYDSSYEGTQTPRYSQNAPRPLSEENIFTRITSYFSFTRQKPDIPRFTSTPIPTPRPTARPTPRSNVGWCGFLSSVLFLSGLVLLLGVLLVPLPAPTTLQKEYITLHKEYTTISTQQEYNSNEATQVHKTCQQHISDQLTDVEKILGDKISHVEKDHETKIQEIRDLLISQHTTLQSRLEELEGAKKKLQDDLVAIATLDRQQSEDIDKIYKHVALNSQNIQENTAKLNPLELKYKTLKSQLTALNSTIKAVQTAQQTYQKHTTDIQTARDAVIEAHSKELEVHSVDISSVHKDVLGLHTKYGNMQDNSDSTKQRQILSTIEMPPGILKKLEQITEELELLKTRQPPVISNKSTQDALTSMTTSYEKLQSETAYLQAQLNKHITENSAVLSEIVGDVSSLKIQTSESEMLTKQQLSALESKIATLLALQNKLDKIEVSVTNTVKELANIQPTTQHPDVKQLQADVSRLLSQIKQLDNKYTEQVAGVKLSVQTANNAIKEVTDIRVVQGKQQTLLEEHSSKTDKTLLRHQQLLTKMKNEMSADMSELQNKLGEINHQVESKIRMIVLEALASVTQQSQETRFFSDWLFSSFLSKEQFDRQVNETRAILPDQEELIHVVISELQNKHHVSLTHESGITIADIQYVVRNALKTFNEDKTGRADFALEALGGHVLGTGCTEPYNEGSPYLHFMSLPLFRVTSPPNVALQPEITPGKCWAFKGHFGYMMIQLADTITVTGFTMEHLPKSLSIENSISTAPKKFTVRGKKHLEDEQTHTFGDYTYTDSDPLQYFPVQFASHTAYDIVELEISSNHGNLDYTCLYRIRVHGKVSRVD